MSALYFNDLRVANRERVGVFRNSKGDLAHKKPDGSDWTPAMWFLAMVGEMGETATLLVRRSFETMSEEEYQTEIAKEIPDIQIYLDLFAQRALDIGTEDGPPLTLASIIADLGTYANAYKKFVRGDYNRGQLHQEGYGALGRAEKALLLLIRTWAHPFEGETGIAHSTGVDLGEATRAKFNATSDKIGRPEIRI